MLYIHIPFCDSKCHYCSFNSYVMSNQHKKNYMKSLLVQLKHETAKNNIKRYESIFIGGGTPSVVESNLYEDIFKYLSKFIDKDVEITIEANPTATKKWMKSIYKLGANRISFGVQSFDEKKLIFLGRNHNTNKAIDAIQDAYDVGFRKINCDIIYDTVLDNKILLENDINTIFDLPITHISAYSLTIDKNTNFYKQPKKQKTDIKLTKYIFDKLSKNGFIQYEISNFAKDISNISKHNLGYWQFKPYIAVGAGAVGCINNQRVYMQKDVVKYIQNPILYKDIEVLSEDNIITEKTMLAFRSIVGVDIGIFDDKQLQNIAIASNEGKLKIKNNKIYSVDFLIADELSLYVLGQ